MDPTNWPLLGSETTFFGGNPTILTNAQQENKDCYQGFQAEHAKT